MIQGCGMHIKKIINKPILMIHEFKIEYLNLPLEDYILTFDDGLNTPYFFITHLLKLDTLKIFNISTNVICRTKISYESINCFDARKKANEGNFENYMNWAMIELLSISKSCLIAGHSHLHKDIRKIKNLNDKIKYIKEDTTLMFKEFEKHLNYRPTTFCFPFNNEDIFYKDILKNQFEVTRFFGSERIDIEDII